MSTLNQRATVNIKKVMEKTETDIPLLTGYTGIHMETLTQLLNGNLSLTVRDLERIGAALNVNPAEFLR